MYVTVSLKIELDTTANLSQMERQIQEAGRAAEKLPRMWKRTGPDASNKAESLADQFRTRGSPSQAVALFGRGQRT